MGTAGRELYNIYDGETRDWERREDETIRSLRPVFHLFDFCSLVFLRHEGGSATHLNPCDGSFNNVSRVSAHREDV